jgi:large subunit ribosomal protein L6
MSRVAKAPVVLAKDVEVTIDSQTISVKGPKGKISQEINQVVSVSKKDNVLEFAPRSKDTDGWAQAGTARALVNNMVHGVTKGFDVTLELVGVGYRAQAQGKKIVLSLGFSHPIEYNLPEGITVETPSNTTIILKGINKQMLGQVASEIRAFRPPEPYKGKGVKYLGENIARKEPKKK